MARTSKNPSTGLLKGVRYITDSQGTRTETHSYEMLEEFVVSDKVYVDDDLVSEEAVTVEDNKIITSYYINQFGEMVLNRVSTIIL